MSHFLPNGRIETKKPENCMQSEGASIVCIIDQCPIERSQGNE